MSECEEPSLIFYISEYDRLSNARGLHPYIGYMGLCSPKRVGLATLVIKEGMVLALLSGNIGYISWKKLPFHNYHKDYHQTLNMFRVTAPAVKVINRVSNFWPGHK